MCAFLCVRSSGRSRCCRRCARWSRRLGRPLTGTQFTCFTSTKVHILTPEESLNREDRARDALSLRQPDYTLARSLCEEARQHLSPLSREVEVVAEVYARLGVLEQRIDSKVSLFRARALSLSLSVSLSVSLSLSVCLSLCLSLSLSLLFKPTNGCIC